MSKPMSMVFVLGIVTLGCASAGSQNLAGSEWRPLTLNGADADPAVEQFVRFESDGKLVGAGGCNNFFGSYELEDDTIELSPLGMTRKMCSEPVMDAELALVNVLQKARSVQRQETELGLYDEQGQLVGSFRQTDWD